MSRKSGLGAGRLARLVLGASITGTGVVLALAGVPGDVLAGDEVPSARERPPWVNEDGTLDWEEVPEEVPCAGPGGAIIGTYPLRQKLLEDLHNAPSPSEVKDEPVTRPTYCDGTPIPGATVIEDGTAPGRTQGLQGFCDLQREYRDAGSALLTGEPVSAAEQSKVSQVVEELSAVSPEGLRGDIRILHDALLSVSEAGGPENVHPSVVENGRQAAQRVTDFAERHC